MRRGAASVAATLGLAAALTLAAAQAARTPTLDERVQITRALPAWLRKYPVGCVRLVTVISHDGRFATVSPQFLVRPGAGVKDPCLRYAGNGHFVLGKQKTWRVLYQGSDPPPCSLKIPHDLESCRR
jgi:hypothetical protein